MDSARTAGSTGSRSRWKRVALLLVASSASILVLGATPAPAATTIGSGLTVDPSFICSNSGACTMRQQALTGAALTAPSDGVLVRWRVKAGAGNTETAANLRVIRGIGALSTGVVTGRTETVPAGAGISTFNTRLPINAGEYIGIDVPINKGQFVAPSGSGTLDGWEPPLADGESRAPTFSGGYELAVNADLESDADHDGYGDESQDACPNDASNTCGTAPPPPPPPTTTPTSTSPGSGTGSAPAAAALLPGACANTPATGTPGSDTLNGTNAGDRIGGGAGNDLIRGLAGDDCLGGGSGNDRVSGGSGNDELAGNSGNDALRGAGGNDGLSGGRGADLLIGGSGRNTYSGGFGNDRINAVNDRRETVRCGAGGTDHATVDSNDRVRGCEHVTRQ